VVDVRPLAPDRSETTVVDDHGAEPRHEPATGPSPSTEPVQVAGWDDNDTELLNRELSWLAFNARVLHIADAESTPLLERAGFLAILASNLDEFFQVRVAGLQDQVAAGIGHRSRDGRTASEQLSAIRDAVEDLNTVLQRLYCEEIRPALRREGIELVDWEDLDPDERADLGERFDSRIFPVLTPLSVDPGHPFPYISDLSLNLAVQVRDPSDGRVRFARVKVPNTLSRWVEVGDRTRFVPLEQVIASHLDSLFPGMEVLEHHAFRVTRNADLTLEEEEADDLLAAVEMELRRRRFGKAARVEVADSMSDEVLALLMRELDVEEIDVYRSHAPLDLTSLFAIADIDRHELRWPEWHGVTEPELVADEEGGPDVFSVLRDGEVLVHHPYSSFTTSVGEFVHQAALDPQVLAIKLTLYRTSGDSPIVRSLIAAAERGKQVAVLVELKARFDEEANIGWAKRLEQAGVHVAYGLLGLKIHAKTAMVVREESDGIRRYCHIGTGNYNPRTARVYEDLGLLTSDPEVGADLANLFNYLTGFGREIDYDRLLVAPERLRKGLDDLIDAEIASGRGRIIMKMNSLVDSQVIAKLYEASRQGVDIDLIVRGICCLRPGVPGLSERIRVRSIVGRYLEHSRIYHFGNGAGRGQGVTYIGSADLMSRNLDRRVEALVEVTEPVVSGRLLEILEVLLSDDRRAWTLGGDGIWSLRQGPVDIDTHVRLQQIAAARANA
jgi:polyphosphate kinase